MPEACTAGRGEIELIETLWNVNENLICAEMERVRRINRNIVECKYTGASGTWAITEGINRNIVECKYEQALDMWYRLVELIETLWNVNTSL